MVMKYATPRKNGHSKQLQQQNNDDEGVKTTNIQVCIRVRPMLVGANNNNNNNHNDNNIEYKSNTKTPNRRLSRLANISRKKKNNYTSLTEDHHNTDNANGNHTATTTPTTAWNVVSHDTVQQSKQTQRIKGRTSSYTLDQIYEMEANNAEIYQKSVQPLVMATLEGYHSSVFAYGQTSTGKTYTMSGTKHSPGIVPLAVSDMFRAISMSNSDDNTSADRNREYLMRVSYLEIYNEQVIDLLSDNNNNSTIRILEAKGEVAIRGLREEVVTSPNQIFALLQKGNVRRQVGSTQMNQHSSRSHTIVRLCLESSSASNTNSTNTKTRVSSLSLVDLAGSESVRLTGSTGDRRKEGQYINKSLMTLGQVIYKLSESQGDNTPNKHHSTTSTTQQHIPYRDSKLTRLLQPSLSGNAQITCICTISPDTKHLEESHNTLKFATRAKRIQQRSVQNEVDDQNSTLLQEYKMEIEELRQQLAELKSAHTTQEDVKELIQAIQKMEELILTADKLQKRELHPNGTLLELPTPESGDTLLLSPDFVENTPPPLLANQKIVNNNNTKFTFASPQSSSLSRSKRMNNNNNTKNNHPTTPLYQEMHRIQELLDTVLQKRGLGNRNKNKKQQQQQPDDNDNDDDNLLNVTREEELVEELRHQLHQQEVTTSLKSADATFLQSQLLEKDGLLLEVSHILEAAEHRQLELETENATLKKLVEEKDRQLKYQEIKLMSMGSPKSPVIQRL